MDLLAKAKQLEASGQSILHMEIGEPDFPTPSPIIDAGLQALQHGRTRYTVAQGLPALRKAIAAFYQQRYEVSVNPDQIFITPGASGALQLILAALLNPEDELLLGDPGYPCNQNYVHLFGAKAVAMPLDASTHYQPTPSIIDQYSSEKTRGLLLATPSNPTGSALDLEALQALFEVTKSRKQAFIVDEIYHGLTYTEQALATALALPANADDELFVINSFSKYFGMTGWRLGWCVVPEAYVPTLDKLAQNLFLSAPTPAQYAALAAFSDEALAIMEQRRVVLQQRRDYLYAALQDLGFGLGEKPQGGFYLYADCRRFSSDSYVFCHQLLEKTGVAITPGIDFGQHNANHHVRLAYTVPIEQLEEAVGRLRQYLQGRYAPD